MTEYESELPLTPERERIVREVQEYCANLAEEAVKRDEKFGRVDGPDWTAKDAEHVASLFCQDADPWGLFRLCDEKTGYFQIGYRTRDGREWFYILRQMRNQTGSGLFEFFPSRYPASA